MDLENMVIDDKERGVFQVHRRSMTSSDILTLEHERIFSRCWLYIGHESEVESPGDYRRRDIAGRPLLFVRGDDDQVRVLYNTCTHRGARVCRLDEGNARTFQCFYHAWTFKNTGELAARPDEPGYSEACGPEVFALKSPPRVESYRGFYFVNFNPHAEDLVTYLAGAKEYIDLVVDQSEIGMRVLPGTHKYGCRANWKLLVENSIDGYHTVPLHTTYFDYLRSQGQDMSRRANADTSRSYALGNGHAAVESPAPYGRPVALWHPLFGEEAKPEIERIRARLTERFGEARAARIAGTRRLLLIYPNLLLHDIMATTIRQIWPKGHDYMEVNAWALAPKEESDQLLARRLDSFYTFLGPGAFATPDDVEALEACQQGFGCEEVEWSDMSRGMHRVPRSPDEAQIRAFWREWHANLLGIEHADHWEALKTDENYSVLSAE